MKGIDTGYGLPAQRAMGMLYPEDQRFYNDPVSEKFLNWSGKLFIGFMRLPFMFQLVTKFYEAAYPGMLGYMYCRFKYYDDVIVDRLKRGEVDVIVNLGAGMDAKAYSIPGLDRIKYFEVDHPTVISNKIKTVEQALGELPAHVTYVPVDFDLESTGEKLESAGFDPSRRTLFIWESVSPYLTREANEKVFEYVSRAVPGSELLFSYVPQSMISGEGLTNKVLIKLHKIMVQRHGMLKSGYDPEKMESLLDKHGLKIKDHVGPDEFKSRYVKLQQLGLDVIEVERIIAAERV